MCFGICVLRLVLCTFGSLCFDIMFCFFFFKQKTAYELRISDWSSDVFSSDLSRDRHVELASGPRKATVSGTGFEGPHRVEVGWRLHCGQRFSSSPNQIGRASL